MTAEVIDLQAVLTSRRQNAAAAGRIPPSEARHDARRALAGRGSGAPSRPAFKGNKMSTLVLELRQGDLMVVNGAPIRFRNRTRIELAAKARFLFGKQIMAPDGANTPARRIYFALQTAYIGGDEEREPGLAAARRLIAEFMEATTSPTVREMLARSLEAAEADDCYLALKIARRVMRHEEEVLGLPPLPAPRRDIPEPASNG
jgi:flagellar protein FlbT